MKIFAAVATIAATAMLGTMHADAAGYSTTKSNIRNLGAEQCDPKTDKNCPQPATKSPDPSSGNSAREVKVIPQSEAEAISTSSKSKVESQGAAPKSNRSVSGTISVRDTSVAAKGQGAKRTGDPLPDGDVSPEKKTGGAARTKAP